MLGGCSSSHVLFNYCASYIQIIGHSPEFLIGCQKKKKEKKSQITEQEEETNRIQFKHVSYFWILFFFLLSTPFDSSVVCFLTLFTFRKNENKPVHMFPSLSVPTSWHLNANKSKGKRRQDKHMKFEGGNYFAVEKHEGL